jgi:hypothetical protein
MYRRVLVFSTAVLLFGVSSACGDNHQVKPYASDGRLGTSNSNPNMPTSPTYHTYNDDTQMIYAALKPIKGIRNVSVRLHGADATIIIRPDDLASTEDRQRIAKQAQTAVSAMMPRYRVHVDVK